MIRPAALTLILSLASIATAQTPDATPAATVPAPAPAPIPAAPTPSEPVAAATTATVATMAADGADGIESYEVRLKQTDRRLTLGIFGEVSQFAKSGASLQGYTIDGLVSYAVSSKYAAQFSVAQALTMQGGMSLLFTGFRLGPAYAVQGEFLRRGSNLTVNGQETVTVAPVERPLLAVDVAADQYLFNGTSRIVPATGLSLGVRYDRRMFNYPLSFTARYGSLTISALPATAMTVGVGLMIPF